MIEESRPQMLALEYIGEYAGRTTSSGRALSRISESATKDVQRFGAMLIEDWGGSVSIILHMRPPIVDVV